jgi:PAS domain S-box-containing protein
MTHIAQKIEGLLKQVKSDLSGKENPAIEPENARTSNEPALLYEHAPIGILAINQEKKIVKFNREAEKIFGYAAAEILGKHVVTLIPERYRNFHFRPFGAVMGHPESSSKTFEFIGLKKNGNEFPVELSYCLTTQEAARLMVISARDISSRKGLEIEMKERTDVLQEYLKLHNQWLTETEQKYTALVEVSKTGILYLKEDATVFDCNTVAEEMLGQKKDEIVGRRITTIMPERERIKADEIIVKIITDVIQFGVEKVMNGCMVGSGYREIPIELYFKKMQKGSEQHIICMIRDITTMQQIEDQLITSQKFEGLGVLMGGMVHNFKNVMTSIMGYSSLMKTMVGGDAKLNRYLNIIETSCARAADLSKEVLNAGKKQDTSKSLLNINTLVERSVVLFEECMDKRFTVEKDLDTSLSFAEINESQIEQVLLNLLINARDAMPDGGKIFLKTQNLYLNYEACKNYQNVTGGNFVEIVVKDTGSGIHKDIQRNIFNPFFTTKEEDKGTGLGLATVERIVKSHRGFVEVFSKYGEGATFKIYLPAAEKAVITSQDTTTHKEKRSGSETILAVDDENIIIRTITESLGSLGYHVISASDGCEAVKLFVENKSKIDLIILDLMMPAMNGYEAFKEIKAMDPCSKIILCTGYVADDSVQEMLNNGVKGLLKKPYRIEDLSRAVRLVLDEQIAGSA